MKTGAVGVDGSIGGWTPGGEWGGVHLISDGLKTFKSRKLLYRLVLNYASFRLHDSI